MKISKKDLKNKRLWKPVYGRYSYNVTKKRLLDLEKAGADEEKLHSSRLFMDRVYNQYSGKVPTKKYGFVFAIPTRINRKSTQYSSEAWSFLPILSELNEEVAQVLISELPPCVLDEYHDTSDNAVGAILFVPLFTDMIHDLKPRIRVKMKLDKVIKHVAIFVSDSLQAEIMGLGGTLSKITRYGKDFEKYGLVTTTGHAGTVHLIYKQFGRITEEFFEPMKSLSVGIIGAGAIGEASAKMILESQPDTYIVMYDIRKQFLEKITKELNELYPGKVHAAKSNDEVLNSADITISAVTSPIKIGDDVDLTNKFIIDDSQPGSFSLSDVRAHSGNLVWVVGKDISEDRLLTRRSEFRYGDEGLANVGDVWGCEAEVASLWLTGKLELAVREAVSPKSVNEIGAVMDEVGIDCANWQVSGIEVSLKKDAQK